jgi:L-alanine-DL-glutamate epimerase-like enolase superfamily enzyme
VPPTITSVENFEFTYGVEDVGADGHGFNLVYEPGTTTERALFAVRIHTDAGVTGEYVGGNSPGATRLNTIADRLVGKDALARERHWSELKRARVAEGFGLDVEFHAPGPAQRHCIAATRNTNYYEMALVHPNCRTPEPPVYAGGYEDELEAVDNGYVEIPDGPGLGVEYDWDFIESRRSGTLYTYE